MLLFYSLVLGPAFFILIRAMRASQRVTQMADTKDNLLAGMNLLVRHLIQTGEGIPTNGIPLPSGVGMTRISSPGQNHLGLMVPQQLAGSCCGRGAGQRQTWRPKATAIGSAPKTKSRAVRPHRPAERYRE